MTTAPIAFLGLGRLGLPVATNLVESGHALRVWNRTAAKADPLVGKGSASASLREAFALAQAEGVAPAAMLAMITQTLFPSSVYENHGKLAAENSPLLAQSKVPGKDLALF